MSRTSDIVVALATAQSPASGNPYHTEKGNRFQDHAYFDEEYEQTGNSPTVDFANGNKQRATGDSLDTITLSAPGVGSYMLRLPDSSSLTTITPTPRWDGGNAPDFSTGEAVIALYYDGTNWAGSAMVNIS